MKTVKTNNYSQAVKEVEALDKNQVSKINEEIKDSEKHLNHVVTVTVKDRPGEAKNDVKVNTIIVNDDKLKKLLKNFKFLGYSKIILLHESETVKKSINKEIQEIGAKDLPLTEDQLLIAKQAKELEELKARLAKQSKEGTFTDQLPGSSSGQDGKDPFKLQLTDGDGNVSEVSQADFESDYVKANEKGLKADFLGFGEKYGIVMDDAKDNTERKSLIDSYYESTMSLFDGESDK